MVARALHIISRVCAFLAVLAGVFAGLLTVFASAFTCFDSCPTAEQYFARFVPGTQYVLTPCIALEAIALLIFVAYCVVTRQLGRALRQAAVFVVIGLVGVAALVALFQVCQANPPITADGYVAETPAETWMVWWGFAIATMAGIWTSVLAGLQWSRGAQQTPTAPV